MIHVCIFCGEGVEVDDLREHAEAHNPNFRTVSWEALETDIYKAVLRSEFKVLDKAE